MEDLAAAGYVEDAAEPMPEALTEAERERYGRGRALFRWMDRTPGRSSWDAQLLLRQARVVVVGVGGVGCTAALALTVSGVGRVHCIEPDLVELSNLHRQILYTEADLGRPKVDAAVRRLREHNSQVLVTGERLLIDSPRTLEGSIGGCDVLVLAADRPEEIRSWANQVCQATGTAWVHGGYHGPQINIGLYRPGFGPCYDCGQVARRERVAGLSPMACWPLTAGHIEVHAANAVTAGMAGHLVAHATISLITGTPALRTNCEFGLNLVTLEDNYLIGLDSPRSDCPTCGH